jgi:Na+/H+ antiporter NhaC
MNLSTYESLIVVALFALALSGMLWVAWMRTRLRPRIVLAFLAFATLAAVDAVILINNKPVYETNR